MAATEPCRLLPWDTEFWGVPIGRVESTLSGDDAVRAVEEWANAHHVRCLYFHAAAGEAAPMQVAAAAGYVPVDVRIELDHRTIREEPSSEGIRAWTPADLGQLRSIARESHRDTRFYSDPGFPDSRCDDLYETWIVRSCEGWADAVLVADDASGYVSCHLTEGIASIGLIAVDAAARGRGVGERLVRGAVAWAAAEGAEAMTVATQARNLAALRTFQRVGFATTGVGVWFHRWFDR